MMIPKEVREKVLVELYRRFDETSWEQLASNEKSTAYERFVADPLIGGELSPFLDEGRIRLWIKDGPAKEYVRALEGVGPYAHLTMRALAGPSYVIASALGDGWNIVDGSLDVKPMRCRATSVGGESRFVVWGPISSLKELFWHAALHIAETPSVGAIVVIARTGAAPVPASKWSLVVRLCTTVGAECRSVQRSVTRKDR